MKVFFNPIILNNTKKYISNFSELSSWQHRLICGGASIGIQYNIESKNKNIDAKTRRTATTRTTTKLTVGLLCGLAVRYLGEKIGSKLFLNDLKTETIAKGSKETIEDQVKHLKKYSSGYFLSKKGKLFKQEINKKGNYILKKLEFKNFSLSKKQLKFLLKNNEDIIKTLSKSFGNVLALIATIAATISIEPKITNKVSNSILGGISND